jgi:hypothetical protein
MVTLFGYGITAIAALILFAMAVALVKSKPNMGIMLAGLTVLPLWESSRPSPFVTISGLNVFPSDVITITLFAAGVLGFAQLRENLQGWLVPWSLFGTLVVASLIRGALMFGMGAAANESRTILWFFLAMTWALAVDPDRLRLHTASLILGWGLVAVAVYHGFRYGVGGASSWVYLADGTRKPARFLVADQALILLCSAGTVFLGPSGSEKVRKWSAASAFVFMGVVVLAQNRSAWVAAGAGIVAVLIWSGQKQLRNRVLVTVVVTSWAVISVLLSGIVNPGSAFTRSASDFGTYEWRTLSWQTLVSEAIEKGPVAIATGEPFGSGFLRKVGNGTWTTVGPHNWYVEIFLRLGIIGLILIVAMLIMAVAKSRATQPVWTFMPVAIAAFGWAYSVNWWVAPWLGAAMLASYRARRDTPANFETPPTGNLRARPVGQVGFADTRGNIHLAKTGSMRY